MAESNYIINKEHLADFENIINTIVNKVVRELLLNDQTLQIIQNTYVIDNLDSDSDKYALSANMGKKIKEHIQALINTVYNNIVDNLYDTSSFKFLSAHMGYMLNKRIEALERTAAKGGSINSEFPKGAIVMWSGSISDIPYGWALCDGQDGRPNLLNRFVKGIQYNTKSPGSMGGAHQIVIAEENLPQHNHNIVHTHLTKTHTHNNKHTHKINFKTDITGEHSHEYKVDSRTWKASLFATNNIIGINHISSGEHIIPAAKKKLTNTNNDYAFSEETQLSLGHSHNIYGNTDENEDKTSDTVVEIEQYKGYSQNTGKNMPITIEPQYYELAFIIKL